ncbi:hypothetical protein A9K81_22870 [Pseudomonas syringae pv. syringae]|nr:hypothetical protein A9K81_22870 [Pseudomonas syringae pv. syringae]
MAVLCIFTSCLGRFLAVISKVPAAVLATLTAGLGCAFRVIFEVTSILIVLVILCRLIYLTSG